MTEEVYIQKKSYPVYPEGLYPAKITQIESQDGKYGRQCRIWFELTDVDEDGATLIGWTSESYTDKSKLYRWTRSAMGAEFKPEEDFRGSMLLDRRVVLKVSKRFNADGGEFNKVEDVIAVRNQAPGQPPIWEE